MPARVGSWVLYGCSDDAASNRIRYAVPGFGPSLADHRNITTRRLGADQREHGRTTYAESGPSSLRGA